MSLDKIESGKVLEVIKKEIMKISLIDSYLLDKQGFSNIKSPTTIKQYDTVLISNFYNRWLLVRVEDYFKYQKVIIWVNLLFGSKPANLDIVEYLNSKPKNINIKQKMIFKANDEVELSVKLGNIFRCLLENPDENVRKILDGSLWIDSPFDWHNYK